MGEIEAVHLCVVTAAEIEYKIATGLLTENIFSAEGEMSLCRGRFGDRQVTVLKSEIGAIGFAKRLADHLQNSHYNLLVIAGLAGALDPRLKIGDAVVLDLSHKARTNQISLNSREKRLAREEKASISCNNQVSRLILESLQASGLSCFLGAGVTVDRIITRAREKVSLGMRYNALAVDMETYEVLAVCALYDLPATALRVVSDEAGSDLPDFNRALKPDGRMSIWRVGAAMLMSPRISVRFLLGMRPAVDALRANLKAVLSSLGECRMIKAVVTER
jgi:nucleoside phosphorylase